MYRSPVDLPPDAGGDEVVRCIAKTGAARGFVDSLTDPQNASPDLTRFREYSYSLVQRFSRLGVSLMMTYEVPELFGLRALTQYGASHLADNVVLLQYRDIDSTIARTITILKTRASHHDPRVQ